MRKFFSIAFLVLAFALNACSGERKGSFEQLPKSAQEIIVQHFDKTGIASVKIDNDDRTTEYEVRFANGAEVDFDQDGNLKKIECKPNQVPEALIASEIVAYVKENYPSSLIVEWEKEKKGSKVELNNGVELIFNNLNQFVGIDK